MIAIIVQARMGSSRLPGKVLKPIAGRPMLSYQVERLRRVAHENKIVIATTESFADNAIVGFCQSEKIDVYRGSEQDVLSRFYGAAIQYQASMIVRVTSDCPLIDPGLIDQAIAAYLDSGDQCDYVSNMLVPSWPYGMAVEVVSFAVLKQANTESTDAAEREHVTPFIYWRPQRFRIKSLTMTPNLSHYRWTVDTPEDFELISRILSSLYPRKPIFSMTDVLALLGEHPDWALLNAHVQQKQALRT
jgi:spore coat polysaccharide biosynthesis protein SpsF